MSKDQTDADKAKSSRGAAPPEGGEMTTETPKDKPKSSDAESKPPSIHEQIYAFYQSERVDRAGGVYRPSLRHPRNIEPIDQLLGPGAKPVNEKDQKR